jgi:hypothetical protein
MKKNFSPIRSVIIIITMILSFVVQSCFSSSNESKKYVPSKQDAVAHSHVYVDKLLKSPGSANYPYQADETIDQLNDSTFTVLSYVDSQNSFGASMRTYYKCKIVLHSDETSECFDLKLEEAK